TAGFSRRPLRSSGRRVPGASVLSVPSLFPTPGRAEGAVLAVGEVLALLVRAAQVALGHRHLLDPVPEEEVLQLLLHLRVGRHVRGHPLLQDRLGTVSKDDSGGDLRGRLVVGAVQGHGAEGVRRLLPTRTQGQVVLDGLAVAAVLVLLAAAAGAGGVAGDAGAGHGLLLRANCPLTSPMTIRTLLGKRSSALAP